MRKDRASLTAWGIAAGRAIESEKPVEERITYDPYARQFVGGWLYPFMAFFVKTGYAELRGPGTFGFLMARERYIDDTLQHFIDLGLQQLVILGAGYDSRAYRFEGLKKGVKVFEVDHPATQADKVEKLKQILGKVPEYVTFVPIDFNTQSLADRLYANGYDRNLKTLFIWQGVSMYLTPEAVDNTLTFVSKNSASGSAIVFDYIYQEVVNGVYKHGEVANMRRYRFMTGEGLTFGIPEGSIQDFLMARGFSEVQDASSVEMKNMYFHGKNANRKVVPGYGIATAII